MRLTHVSCFSGIGGIDLAADWAGFKTVQFVERNPFCQQRLSELWPGVPIHDDISTFEGTRLAGTVDLVSGGFPCQDVSTGGKKAGIFGERSGLFIHLVRIICEIRPRFALLENVSGLIIGRGISAVLGALAEVGFDAIWGSVQAAEVGADHERERVFIVAYPEGGGHPQLESKIANAYQNGTSDTAAQKQWRLSELSSPLSGVGGVRAMPPPEFVRMVDGVPTELDLARIQALGNAVCPPQVYPVVRVLAEVLGK